MSGDESGNVLAVDVLSCADEPVRTINSIQPFAAVIFAELESGLIRFASSNLSEACGLECAEILGRPVTDVLGREIWHAMNNRAMTPDYRTRRMSVGTFECDAGTFVATGFANAQGHVIELEALPDASDHKADLDDHVATLIHEIKDADFLQPMLEKTVRSLRFLTGFDRVLVYKFDPDFNGEVIAEHRVSAIDEMLGLRFPHSDIPPQAREVMQAVPLRVIADGTATQPVLLAMEPRDAPLDIGLALCRGVPDVHLQYIQNMGVRGSMTLSLVVGNKLWGMISFHHRRPRLVSVAMRAVLEEFLLFLNVKLRALLQGESLALIDRIEAVKGAIMMELEDDQALERAFETIGPILMEVFKGTGFASLAGSQSYQSGVVPGQAVLDRLLHLGNNRPNQVLPINDLASTYPHLASDLSGVAGALVASTTKNRAIAIFREETTQKIAWAGKPEKLSDVTGRLEPRASFKRYVEEVMGSCDPWTDQDTELARRLWPIVVSAERQSLLNTLNRQQQLMINELNHRVRNILALVRAVSRQARRRYGSLNSYAKSLEARIQALAAAHDIGQGVGLKSVSVRSIIESEIGPYLAEEDERVALSGQDHFLAPEMAPIFALIVHELATNAAKYGALSESEGGVTIDLARDHEGVHMTWIEAGGPRVQVPEDPGFGTVLIQHAVPHELGGRAQLFFDPTGVRAEIFLPETHLRQEDIAPKFEPRPLETDAKDLPNPEPQGVVMLVEDNFLIAKEMVDQLQEFGFSMVEVFSNAEDAIDFLQDVSPVLSILDVNLGNGRTSAPIARKLQENKLPFIFATGYGEVSNDDEEFQSALNLTKPVSNEELRHSIAVALS